MSDRLSGIEEAAAWHDREAAKLKARLDRLSGKRDLPGFSTVAGGRRIGFSGIWPSETRAALRDEIATHEWCAKEIRALAAVVAEPETMGAA